MSQPFDPAAAPPASPNEAAWLRDRDLAQETALLHVGAGLLDPASVSGAGVQGTPTERLGRNLLTESEHASNVRSGRELLAKAPRLESASSADEIARRGPDDPAVGYLRDNADSLIGELSTKQAKAAQKLVDKYESLASLRPALADVKALIPEDKQLEQSRWVTRTRDQLSDALDGLPSNAAAPLRERLAKLGTGQKPERWFLEATALSDALLKASAQEGRSDAAVGETLTQARDLLKSGLLDQGLWGDAANTESQRSAGYEQRYGDHLDAFEAALTTPIGAKGRRADPGKFAELLAAGDDSPAAATLRSVIDGARATADVAKRFGRGADAAELLASIRDLDRVGRQGAAVRAARGVGVSREADDPAAAAMEWLARGGTPGAPGEAGLGGAYAQRELEVAAMTGEPSAVAEAAAQTMAARDSAYRAVTGMIRRTGEDARAGVLGLLEPEDDEGEAPELGGLPAPRVTQANFAATRTHLDKMAADPAYFGEVMAASFGTLPEAAPEVFAAISAQTAKVTQYLAAVAPGKNAGGPFGKPQPVADDELWEFNERVGALTEPTFMRDSIRTGMLSQTAAEAYREMNPRQYGELQRETFQRLDELRTRGVPIPVQARQTIETLMGIDGGGEMALTWPVAERAYMAIARKHAAGSAVSGGDSNAAKETGMESGALATLHNGASAIAQTG